jgi:hypothetical protein
VPSPGEGAAQEQSGRAGSDDGDLHAASPVIQDVVQIDYTEDAANNRSTSTDIQEAR